MLASSLPLPFLDTYSVVYLYADSCIYAHIHAEYILTQWFKRATQFFEKYASHSIWKVRKGYSRFYGERESWRPNRTLMAISVVSFSFSRAAQPEAQGPSSLWNDGFLYRIWSPAPGVPRAPYAGWWLSLPPLLSYFSFSPTHLTSYLQRVI